MSRFAAGYEAIARALLVVVVINVAFIAHTVAGAVLGGFFPSVAASCTTARTWAIDTDRSWTVRETWRVFHRAWLEELRGANAVGWPLLAGGLVLVWEYYVVNWNSTGVLGAASSGVLLVTILAYGVFSLVVWVVRANFDERPWWIVRTSVQLVLARPLCTVMILAVVALTVWCWWTWPGTLMAFGFALPLVATVLCVYSYARLPGMDARAALA